jgi:hypothetical protein
MKVGFLAMRAALPVGLMVTLSSSAAVAAIGMCVLIFLLMTPLPAGVAAQCHPIVFATYTFEIGRSEIRKRR